MSDIIALIPSSVSVDAIQALKQSQTWQELCLAYSPAEIQLKSCDLFSVPTIQSQIQAADQVIFIAIEGLVSARLIQAAPNVLHSLVADSLAQALSLSGKSRLLYVDLSGDTLDDYTVWETIFDNYQLQLEIFRPQTLFKVLLPQTSGDSTVCSVQILPLISTHTASWYIASYYEFLSKKLWPVIRIHIQLEQQILIYFNGCPWPLLELSFDPDKSHPEHVSYQVTGGLLVKRQTRFKPRLELSLMKPLNQAVLALHDFVPALPWPLYLVSQAWIHLWTVYAFKRRLEAADFKF